MFFTDKFIIVIKILALNFEFPLSRRIVRISNYAEWIYYGHEKLTAHQSLNVVWTKDSAARDFELTFLDFVTSCFHYLDIKKGLLLL